MKDFGNTGGIRNGGIFGTPENGDFIKNQTTPSQYYIPGDQWYPALTMEPTQGYMTNFASSHTLIYPTVASAAWPPSIAQLSVVGSTTAAPRIDVSACRPSTAVTEHAIAVIVTTCKPTIVARRHGRGAPTASGELFQRVIG